MGKRKKSNSDKSVNIPEVVVVDDEADLDLGTNVKTRKKKTRSSKVKGLIRDKLPHRKLEEGPSRAERVLQKVGRLLTERNHDNPEGASNASALPKPQGANELPPDEYSGRRATIAELSNAEKAKLNSFAKIRERSITAPARYKRKNGSPQTA